MLGMLLKNTQSKIYLMTNVRKVFENTQSKIYLMTNVRNAFEKHSISDISHDQC